MLSYAIRIYIIFSLVIVVAFFMVLTSVDVLLTPIWLYAPEETVALFQRMYVAVIIISLISVIYGVIIAVFFYNRGLNKYQDLTRRVENLDHQNYIRLASLRFPEQDEFGNLGQKLNKLISKIDFYDQTKTILGQLEKEKFHMVSSRADFPILLIDTSANEPYITYHNQSFRDLFLKKSVFIDNNGHTQTRYFNIDLKPLAHLTINNEEHPSFFEEKQLHWIKNVSMSFEKSQTLYDLSFSDLKGTKKYTFGEVIFLPLNNSIDSSMSQVLCLFTKREDEQKKSLLPSPLTEGY